MDATAPVYSITGRWEAGSGSFALYAASAGGVYRYDTALDTTLVVIRPVDGQVFRGVAIPPSVSFLPPGNRRLHHLGKKNSNAAGSVPQQIAFAAR